MLLHVKSVCKREKLWEEACKPFSNDSFETVGKVIFSFVKWVSFTFVPLWCGDGIRNILLRVVCDITMEFSGFLS